MQILPAASHRRMPWKNGGGETIEIAVSPVGATIDDFDWRVSMARVATDGPFSRFPGIDRTLVVIDGEGLVLEVDGRETRLAPGAPFAFAGDAATSARLVAGPIVDLNTMTRRGRWRHAVRLVEAPCALAGLAIVVARGAVVADGVTLAVDDAVVGATRITQVTRAYVIELVAA